MSFSRSIKTDLALFPPGSLSFADLALGIEADATLTSIRRRDLLSGITRVASALGLPMTDIPCQSRWLQPRLARIAPAQLGVTTKTWQNSISNLRSAMAHAGIVERRQCSTNDLAPEWQALWQDVLKSGEPNVSHAVRRFVHFLSGLGISPTRFTQEHATAFREALVRNEISKDPETAWRAAVNGWNLAGKRLAAWSRTRLMLPSRMLEVKLPESAFPPKFIDTLDTWIGTLAVPDPLAENGGARARSAATCAQYRAQLLRFASEIVHSGVPPAALTGLELLIEPAMAERGLRRMLARNGGETNRSIADTAGLLRNLARLLGAPAPQRKALKTLAGKLALPARTGMTDRNRARLRVLQDPMQQRRLLTLAEDIFARPISKSQHYAELLAREDALAIALLLVCPLRIKNIAAINLERHLQRPGDGRVYLVLDQGETKTGQPIEFELPRDVVDLINQHLATRAPLLCPAGTACLFPKRCGAEAIDGNALSSRIAKRVRRELGLEMNAHLFRHFAVMTWLDANPGGYEVARRLLGHKALSHTINMYSGLETKSATRAYADLVETLRNSG